MADTTDIEIFLNGQWLPAATLQTLDDDRCRVDYLPEYLFGQEGAEPISLTLGLHMQPDVRLADDGGSVEVYDRRPPPFLYDLVPQGKGRALLVGLLQRADQDGLVLPLIDAGAFNPIGRLRVRSALAFYERQATSAPQKAEWKDGFTLEDIVGKSEGFLEHLSLHAMLAAGTTGVQGAAPKFLLTQNTHGQWFADLALDDALASAHWLVKLPRGRSEADRAVLRNEAAYLRVAKAMGLRTHEEPQLHGEMLFVRRFDREVDAQGTHRLHQESTASLAGMRGFGGAANLTQLLQAVRAHVSKPLRETVEYMKRDVLNVALRNTDNHARNTAVQKTRQGEVRLTPLFDFAPMFMDPEIIPRSAHWQFAGQRVTDFTDIVQRVAEQLPAGEGEHLIAELSSFSEQVGRLPELAQDLGVEPEVLQQCLKSIERVALELAHLPKAWTQSHG
jgi:serine/threonine-protein kinase HipA